MKNKGLNILLSLYFVLRYLTIILMVYIFVGTYAIESYGLIILIYYIAVNYLAIKHGIIKEIDKRVDVSKEDLLLGTSVFLFIFNLIIFSLYTIISSKFRVYEILIFSVIPVIEFFLVKTKKEKQLLIDIKTKKAIEEYFQDKK